jgi:hypothetical protein
MNIDELATPERGMNGNCLGYPSDTTNECCLYKAPIGFSATIKISAKCNDVTRTFIGRGTSTVSLAEAESKAEFEARQQSEAWLATTGCSAVNLTP